MPTRGEPTGRHTRRTGLIIAASAFLLGAGVVGFFVATGKSRQPATPTPKDAAPLPIAGTPPPTVDLGAPPSGSGSVLDVGNVTLQFIDRDDPSRVAGQLRWESLDPLDSGRSAISKPVGYYYLRSGSIVQIKAPRGRLYTPPKAKQPESGTFDGGVTFSLYRPDAGGKINIDADQPAAVFQTRSMDFNLATGDVSTPDPFTLTAETFTVRGKGLQVLYNQVQEAIELLKIEEQARIDINPAARTAARAAVTPGANPPTPSADPMTLPAGPDTSVATAAAGRVALYRAVFENAVKITQGPRTVTADDMEVFLRLVNNQLPPNAFGRREAAAASQGASGQPAASEGSAANPFTGGSEPIAITWLGRLIVRPLKEAPAELAEDHLLVRLAQSRTNPVEVRDDNLKAVANAATIQYGATTHDLLALGAAGVPARIAAEGRGLAETPRLRLNLASGAGLLDGPGRLAALPSEAQLAAGPTPIENFVSWKDRAEVRLGAGPQWTTGRIESAAFYTDVLAANRSGEVRGQLAHVRFAADEATGDTRLETVHFRDAVRMQAGHDAESAARGLLSADALDVRFEPTPARNGTAGEPTPTVVFAQGRVGGSRRDEVLTAETLTAILGRDDAGDVQLRTARAETDVVYTGPRNLKAVTPRLDADADENLIFLTGEGSRITRDQSLIEGEQFLIRADDRELYGVGRGRFAHTRSLDTGAKSNAPDRVTATWERLFFVSDFDGQAVAEGGAVVTATGEVEQNTLRAEQVRINFTPLPVQDAAVAARPSPERAFLSAEALGALKPDQPGLAIAETRRYLDSAALAARDESKLERLVYLESGRILASDVDGTLSTPQPGKLLVVDKRPAAKPATAPVGNPDPATPGRQELRIGQARGTSLFSWQGDLLLRREAGTLEMHRQTRLIHQPDSAAGEPVAPLILDADHMTAWFTQSGTTAAATTPAGSRASQLQKAVAEGSVLAESAEQRLTADLLTFAVPTNTLEAQANGENNVILTDKTRPTPLIARKLLWQVGPGGQVRVTQPASITTPR